MKVLVGCEESQAVCIEFRKRGHEAYSCDILPCSGGHPEWHIQGDVLEQLDKGWDLGIFFPPCTYLTVTQNKWLKDQPPRKSGRPVGAERREMQKDAVKFVLDLYNSNIERVGIENPVGILSSVFRKPDQVIHPYFFGDPVSKATCLWLKNLPLLYHFRENSIFSDKTWVSPEWHTTKTGKRYPKWSMIDACKIQDLEERSIFRSKTFPGIAKAMAAQWSEDLTK